MCTFNLSADALKLYSYSFVLLVKPSGLAKFFEEGAPPWPILALPWIHPCADLAEKQQHL